MEGFTGMPTGPSEGATSSTKRKRSVSVDRPTPAKSVKTHGSHLQINYLSRHFNDTLPLISAEDTLPSILSLIGDYDGVLQRHESMAGNLGARPLGPILIKRFERLFDGPPKVLKTHGKEGTSVTWLDVVEFARHKPEQFNLEKTRDGIRVCQFYTKQSRVEISEEDYVLIASGMPQKLIPPQPIAEDEEKELGTLEILERNIGHVVQLADQVSARARQLNHRLKNRKNAIISRRESESTATGEPSRPSPSGTPSLQANERGSSNNQVNGDQRTSQSPTSGFVAVNSRPSTVYESGNHPNGYASAASERVKVPAPNLGNGRSLHTASPATRAELLSCFTSPNVHAQASDYDQSSKTPASASRSHHSSKSKPKSSSEHVDFSILMNSASPVPIPNTPSSLLNFNRPSPADRFDDSGPYKAEMLARMDQLQRGDRVLPPCDRCRRLHMDCLKNLTACQGCTKKHAKCSWKDVTDQELRDNPYVPRAEKEEPVEGEIGGEGSSISALVTDDSVQGVRDEELLGEDGSDESVLLSPNRRVRERAIVDQNSPTPKPHENVSNHQSPEESQNIHATVTPTSNAYVSDNIEPQRILPTSDNVVTDRLMADTSSAPPDLPEQVHQHTSNHHSNAFEAVNNTPSDRKSTHYSPHPYPSPAHVIEEEDEKKPISPEAVNTIQESEEKSEHRAWNLLSNHENRHDGERVREHKNYWGITPGKIGANDAM